MKKDRRSTRRLYPNRPIQLIFNCNTPVIGRIHNITVKGAAVEYDGAMLSCRDLKEVMAEIAVDQQSRLKVDGVLCTPVYDISTLAHNQSFRGANMRLCGLEFRQLNKTQNEELQQLLTGIS